MNLKRALVFIASICMGGVAFAADALPSDQDTRALADRAMAEVGKGNVDGAISILQPHTIVPEVELAAMLNQFKIQQPIMANRFGAAVGAEFIEQKRVGQSLIKYVYLQKFERHGVRWQLFFYRGSTGWYMDTMRYDDGIQLLLN